MFKKILIGYDGSDHSERAAELAGDFVRSQKDAQLWLVCVVDMVPVSYGEHYIHQIVVDNKAAGEQLIQEARQFIGDDVTVHEELLFGGAAESIINVAKTNECDLIIMGTRGLGSLRGMLLGSQAHKVIAHAPCPVLTVK